MAFKFVILCSLLAIARAGAIGSVTNYAAPHPTIDAVASTHQNVVRSFDGTVSSYSKSVDTPYSSVHKQDTRISNNVYTPTVTKTVAYTSPVAPVPTAAAYQHHESMPTAIYPQHQHQHHEQQHQHQQHHHEHQHQHQQPHAAVYQHHPQSHHEIAVPATATTTYTHSPAAATYSHNAPGIAAYGSSQTVHYSPADMVSHMSFEGFGTHWGY